MLKLITIILISAILNKLTTYSISKMNIINILEILSIFIFGDYIPKNLKISKNLRTLILPQKIFLYIKNYQMN
jgi:hypothetical protein